MKESRLTFLFPHGVVVSRLITVRVFLVTQTSRRGIHKDRWAVAAPPTALARVGEG